TVLSIFELWSRKTKVPHVLNQKSTPPPLLHGCRGATGNSFSFENLCHGHEEDFHVKEKRAISNIPDIKRKFLRPRNCIAAIHLCPSRDTRPHRMAQTLLLIVQGQIFDQ